MKKNFITVLLIFSLFLSKNIFANPYQPGSQSWHNWNAMAQSEADRIKNQQNQNYNQGPTVYYLYMAYSSETGAYGYSIWSNSAKNAKNDAYRNCKKYNNNKKCDVGFSWHGYSYDELGTMALGYDESEGKWEGFSALGANYSMNNCIDAGMKDCFLAVSKPY